MTVLEDGSTVRQAQRDDARVTWLGRLLRASSIDELPQLINVLTGDMSLVGPRPHAVVHDDEYGKLIDNYMYRHHVKPGITGWAQIHGFRGETDVALMAKRIQRDLWYINNWSLWLDLKIMARTCVEVLRGRECVLSYRNRGATICVAGKGPRAHDFSSCRSVTRSLRTVNSSTCNAPIRAFFRAKRPIAI